MDCFFRCSFRPEVVRGVISGELGQVGMDVPVKFGDSRSNCSRDIRLPQFIKPTNDDACLRTLRFCLKKTLGRLPIAQWLDYIQSGAKVISQQDRTDKVIRSSPARSTTAQHNALILPDLRSVIWPGLWRKLTIVHDGTHHFTVSRQCVLKFR